MITTDDNNIIGFYAGFNSCEQEQEKVKDYLWGNNGLKEKLKSLKWQNYGQDVHLILFQFHVNPIPYEREHLMEIESYRSKEKSVGIPVVLDKENFFKLNEDDRETFFQTTIQNKLDLLNEKIKRNKLDLDLFKLKGDINQIFNK